MLDKLIYFAALLGSREKSEKGATATEYGLLLAFVAVIIVAALTAFGTQIQAFFTTVGNTIAGLPGNFGG